MLVIRLIEEHIFAIIALCGILLKNTFSADSVLMAQLFPKLVANYPISKRLPSESIYDDLTYSSCHTGQLAT